MNDSVDPFPLFNGCDVPRKALFDHLEEGGTVESFVTKFPTVTWDRARAVLYMAQEKCGKMANEGRRPVSLYAAYLAFVTEPEPPDADLLALASVAGDKEAFQCVMAERGCSYFTAELIDEMVAEARQHGAASQHVPPGPQG